MAGMAKAAFVGLFASLIAALIVLIVYINLTPTYANQTAVLETDTAGDLSTSEESLIGLSTLAWVLGIPIVAFLIPFMAIARFGGG